MAATVHIVSYHGAAGATTANVESTTIRFRTDDTDTVDGTAPITVPGSGNAYSWIKHLALSAATAPANLLGNVKFYSDGANGMGSGTDIQVKDTATYLNPITNAATPLTGTTSAFTYTSGSPLSVTGSTSGTGKFTDYVQMQFSIGTGTPQGNCPAETMTFSYDES